MKYSAMLRPMTKSLVEYYTIGDRFQAFIISRDRFERRPRSDDDGDVRASLKGLTFQLSKFHLNPAYVQTACDRSYCRQLNITFESCIGS